MSKEPLIEQELKNLQKELGVLSLVIAKRDRAPLDDIEVRGAALSLASLYNGIERILKQILSHSKEAFGKSANWHAELLQKSNALGAISDRTLQDLKGFLGFRHFVRHAYSFEIDPKAIDAILKAAPELVKHFIQEVEVFVGHPG